jgi:DNA polymerase I-like protein with 3'-5' exonuclease and polymerase domains
MIQAKTHIIGDYAAFNRLKDYVKRLGPEYMVLDVETDSENEKKANLYGIAICFTETTAFYIPWRNNKTELLWTKEQESEISQWIYDTASTTKLINHNIIYDILVLENNLGINLTEFIYSDTILQHHALSEEPPHGLKEIAVQILGPWADKAQKAMIDSVEANGGKFNKTQKDMYLADTALLAEYAMWDVLLTLKLFKLFEPKLEEQGLKKLFYEEEIIPLYKEVTINMKRLGFPIDLTHFNNLNSQIQQHIDNLEIEILQDIESLIEPFVQELLDKKFPLGIGGLFPKVVAEKYGITIPLMKRKNKDTGEYYHTETLAAKALEKQKALTPEFAWFYDWIINKGEHTPKEVLIIKKAVQEHLFFRKKEMDGNPRNYVFNLKSGDHLGYLLYEALGIQCTHFTDNGKKQTGAEVLDEIIETHAERNPYLPKLLDYRKLSKLQSTYIVGILDRQINGKIHTSMLQFGTTSGRFASRNPNLNNLPSLKEEGVLSEVVVEYTNAIRAGMTVEDSDLLIGCDFSALEPHIAAYVSGDSGLIDIFVQGHDFYSAIGMKQFNKTDCSPFNDGTEESFAKKYKSLRSLVKTYSLASFYGATAPRISQVLGNSTQEAQELLNGYFKTFPGIKKFINSSHIQATTKGYVKTKLGRIRHLERAKELHTKYGKNLLDYRWAKAKGLTKERSELKNLLNNATNFQIQGFAAHCLNRAMLKMTRKFKELGLDADILLPIHDEVLVRAKKEQAEKVAEIVKWAMETCVDINPIKLKASPVIGRNYAECK